MTSHELLPGFVLVLVFMIATWVTTFCHKKLIDLLKESNDDHEQRLNTLEGRTISSSREEEKQQHTNTQQRKD